MLEGIDDLTRIFRKVKCLINVGLNLIQTHLFILEIITDFQVNLVRMAEHQVFIGCPKSLALATWIGNCH